MIRSCALTSFLRVPIVAASPSQASVHIGPVDVELMSLRRQRQEIGWSLLRELILSSTSSNLSSTLWKIHEDFLGSFISWTSTTGVQYGIANTEMSEPSPLISGGVFHLPWSFGQVVKMEPKTTRPRLEVLRRVLKGVRRTLGVLSLTS